MTHAYRPDVVASGLGEMLSQFDGAPKLRRLAEIFLEQLQDVENVVLDLVYERTLDGASGFWLDVIGRILGEPRGGLDDNAYRRFLEARAVVIFSTGVREDVLSIMSLLTQSDDIHVQSNFPAAFIVNYTTPSALLGSIRQRIRSAILAAIGKGIAVEVVEAQPDYFGFADDPDALGFDDGTFATTL